MFSAGTTPWFWDLYSNRHEASKRSHWERDSDNSEINCNLDVGDFSFTVLRHLFKKLNVCKSVKRDSGINFEASFVAVYSNYILLFCMKSENDWKWYSVSISHSWAHKLNPRRQSTCSMVLIFLQASVGATAVHLCPKSGTIQMKWSEV